MEIIVKGEALDLPDRFSIEIEDTNPVYNEKGSQSVPANVPATRRNNRLLSFPTRIDAGIDPNNPERAAIVQDGGYIRRGIMNVTSAGTKDGITFNIGFDNSTAYAKWQEKKLSDLSGLPTFSPDLNQQGYAIDLLLYELYTIYQKPNPQTDDFAVFPIAINKTDHNGNQYWEILNLTGKRGLAQPNEVNRIIDNEITQVRVPEGYMVSPFLRVWRILELIFEDMGLSIRSNPFKESLELSKLVVLNNAADSCCRGSIKYADLMPDCTVEEFLNALWVRFGLVYNIIENKSVVELMFIRDIIRQPDYMDIDNNLSEPYNIIYELPQYVKLSAKSSIDGASPSCDRFEDFAKGLDISKIRLGNHVSEWQKTGTADAPVWDGDVRDDWEADYHDPDDPDYPDPDFDYDWDYDYYALSTKAPVAQSDTVPTDGAFLAREFVTGMWYHLDAENGAIRLQSSSFFNWDPQTEGIEPLELSSDDEWVPVIRVSNAGTGTGHEYNGICPTYLFGTRHYHSFIKGSDEAKDDGVSTPLAFMFAYTKGEKTFGRLTPEDDNGKRILLDDGSLPTISLLFQFKDGLFNTFWADYDEILRHGNRSVEVSGVINKLDLYRLNILKPVRLGNIRCLIDTVNYSLPAGKNVPVDMKLHTIQTQGIYDIKAEQNVPNFSVAGRRLEWRLKSETYGDNLNNIDARSAAAKKYCDIEGYRPSGSQGDYYTVDPRSAILISMSRRQTWQNDPSLPAPVIQGQRNLRKYKAILTYEIFEVHDFGYDQDDNEWELAEIPFERIISVEVEYDVELVARWVLA